MKKIIAIDGPCASGKGTISKLIANKYDYLYIDTGAMYRAISYLVIQNNILLSEENEIVNLAKKSKIEFINNNIFLNGLDISKEIRSIEVSKIVSPLSNIKELRKVLVDLQRKMAQNDDVIMEGRDITTVVFPNATYKIYLDASEEERVKRRYKELKEKGINISYEDVKENIQKRDYNDMHKKHGSLKRTQEQIYIDTTNLNIDQVFKKISEIICK